MSRNLSSDTLKALYAAETAEVFLVLLTLSHDSLIDPIRVTSDAVDTISRGKTYTAFPFQLILPDEIENRPPRARLIIDNISREILRSIKNLSTPARITMEIIRAGDADVVEASFPDFVLTNVKYNSLTLEGNLTIEDFTAEPYPATIFSPSTFPNLL